MRKNNAAKKAVEENMGKFYFSFEINVVTP